jgi:AcrR family transcriptional regulator
MAAARVRLQIDERRDQLIELGIRLFLERPYDEISIEEIAEAAHISKGLIYHYFGSKREFYVEAIRAASLHLRKLTEPDPSLPPAARLRAAVDAHLSYIQEHGTLYTAMYRGAATIAPEVEAILEEHRKVVMQWFLKNLGISRPRPVLRSALRAWIAMVEGASLDWIARREVSRDALRELLVSGYIAVLERAFQLDPKASKHAQKASRTGT